MQVSTKDPKLYVPIFKKAFAGREISALSFTNNLSNSPKIDQIMTNNFRQIKTVMVRVNNSNKLLKLLPNKTQRYADMLSKISDVHSSTSVSIVTK